MFSGSAACRHEKAPERDHAVSVLDEPPDARVPLQVAREVDALLGRRVLHAALRRRRDR
jgi:hypothetical protein